MHTLCGLPVVFQTKPGFSIDNMDINQSINQSGIIDSIASSNCFLISDFIDYTLQDIVP